MKKTFISILFALICLFFISCNDGKKESSVEISLPEYRSTTEKLTKDRYKVSVVIETDEVTEEQLMALSDTIVKTLLNENRNLYGAYIGFSSKISDGYYDISMYEYGPGGSASWDENKIKDDKFLQLIRGLKEKSSEEKEIVEQPSYGDYKMISSFRKFTREEKAKDIDKKIEEYLKKEKIDISKDRFKEIYNDVIQWEENKK